MKSFRARRAAAAVLCGGRRRSHSDGQKGQNDKTAVRPGTVRRRRFRSGDRAAGMATASPEARSRSSKRSLTYCQVMTNRPGQRRLWVAALVAVCVAGCGAPSEPAPETPACVTGCDAPWEPAPEAVKIGTAYRYNLYTHCGAGEAKFAGQYWEAAPIEIVSNSSPPGWSDPHQTGVMTRVSETSARSSRPKDRRDAFSYDQGPPTSSGSVCDRAPTWASRTHQKGPPPGGGVGRSLPAL